MVQQVTYIHWVVLIWCNLHCVQADFLQFTDQLLILSGLTLAVDGCRSTVVAVVLWKTKDLDVKRLAYHVVPLPKVLPHDAVVVATPHVTDMTGYQTNRMGAENCI